MNRLRYVLLLLPLAVLAVWSYLYAYDRQVWWTEMSTVAAIMSPANFREPVECLYAEWTAARRVRRSSARRVTCGMPGKIC